MYETCIIAQPTRGVQTQPGALYTNCGGQPALTEPPQLETLTGQPTQTWLWLALMAIFPQIVGHSSINWALGHLPTALVALGLLAEPIGSTLLAWIILREPPTFSTLIGGLLILAGIGIATTVKDKSTYGSHT